MIHGTITKMLLQKRRLQRPHNIHIHCIVIQLKLNFKASSVYTTNIELTKNKKLVSEQIVFHRLSTKTKHLLISSTFGELPNYLPCAIMPYFQTWQQSKTCTPGITLIDKPKKLLVYAEYYVANFLSVWTLDYTM